MTRFEALREVVSPTLLRHAGEVSRLLRELEIPHVLIGGLAVGVHGHPRATRDVDFLVGPEAFASTSPLLVYRDEIKDIAVVGETDVAVQGGLAWSGAETVWWRRSE